MLQASYTRLFLERTWHQAMKPIIISTATPMAMPDNETATAGEVVSKVNGSDVPEENAPVKSKQK